MQESPEDAFIIQESKAQFDKLVHQLPTRMRDVFELLRAGYTTREVSEKMGLIHFGDLGAMLHFFDLFDMVGKVPGF